MKVVPIVFYSHRALILTRNLTEDDEGLSGSKRITTFAKRDPSDYFLSADISNNGVSDVDSGMTWADNIEQFLQNRENNRTISACQKELMGSRVTKRTNSCEAVGSLFGDELLNTPHKNTSTVSDLNSISQQLCEAQKKCNEVFNQSDRL